MSTGVKLAIGATVVIAVTTYMAYVGASSSWQYYLTTDESVAEAEKFVGQRVRVSGRIVDGSLETSADRTQARFAMTGTRETLDVVCSGRLPDNLAEGMDVVVEGRIEASGLLRGDKVLTRCASKYESGQSPASSDGAPANESKGAQ